MASKYPHRSKHCVHQIRRFTAGISIINDIFYGPPSQDPSFAATTTKNRVHRPPPDALLHMSKIEPWKQSSLARMPSNTPGVAIQHDHIGNLPVEIFTEVVKIVVQNSDTTPLIISHVSKQWQDVMYNIASFWDVLVLTHVRPQEKAQFWMEKSKGKLKELCVRFSAVTPGQARLWSDELRMLAWRQLKILRVEKWLVIDFLLEIGQFDSLDNLETLEIDTSNALESFPPSVYNSNHSKLRNLIILSSSSIRFQKAPFQVRGLTSLSLSNVKRPLECLLTLLDLNSLLEHLSMSHVSYGSSRSDTVTMKRLKTLRLDHFFPGAIFAINMPNLETFQIENQSHISGFDNGLHRYSMDAMRTPLGHTRLSKIIFRACEMIGNHTGQAQGVIALLQTSPYLRELEISHTLCDVNFVLELLASTYTPPWVPKPTTNIVPVCPNLTHVDFSGCSGLETGPLLRMVKSRRTSQITPRSQPVRDQNEALSPPDLHCKEISSVIIDFCPKIDPTWVRWLMRRISFVSWKGR